MTLRAHHGMCLSFFQGEGYSDGFTQHMAMVQQSLMQDRLVRVVDGVDEICRKCPNRHGDRCVTQEKVWRYDRQVLTLCGLEAGSVLPYSEFHRLVEEQILISGKREEICGSCEWDALCKL